MNTEYLAARGLKTVNGSVALDFARARSQRGALTSLRCKQVPNAVMMGMMQIQMHGTTDPSIAADCAMVMKVGFNASPFGI